MPLVEPLDPNDFLPFTCPPDWARHIYPPPKNKVLMMLHEYKNLLWQSIYITFVVETPPLSITGRLWRDATRYTELAWLEGVWPVSQHYDGRKELSAGCPAFSAVEAMYMAAPVRREIDEVVDRIARPIVTDLLPMPTGDELRQAIILHRDEVIYLHRPLQQKEETDGERFFRQMKAPWTIDIRPGTVNLYCDVVLPRFERLEPVIKRAVLNRMADLLVQLGA